MIKLFIFVVVVPHLFIEQVHARTLLSQIALLDARQPNAIVAFPPDGSLDSQEGERFAFLPLAFTESPARVQCCVQLGKSTESAWMQQDQTLNGKQAYFTSAKPQSGFIGLVLPLATVITKQRGSTLWLRWPNATKPVQIRYCTSAEGLHVSVQEPRQGAVHSEGAGYYLYLGMALIPTCPQPPNLP